LLLKYWNYFCFQIRSQMYRVSTFVLFSLRSFVRKWLSNFSGLLKLKKFNFKVIFGPTIEPPPKTRVYCFSSRESSQRLKLNKLRMTTKNAFTKMSILIQNFNSERNFEKFLSRDKKVFGPFKSKLKIVIMIL
jgi:hypothetical protein